MLRHRDIAAAPVRPATVTWQVITNLIADTLEKSPHLTRTEVETVMATARAAGLPLVAGGHLDQHPLTLVAGTMYCTLGTVSGSAALSLEENLSPIPGGASAEKFTLYLPTPDPLGDLVGEVAERSPHLSAGRPPSPEAKTASGIGRGAGAAAVDLQALTRRMAQ